MNHLIIIISQYIPAIASGFLLTLAFPKADLDWLAWVALVPLMLSLYQSDGDKKKAFNAGFIMGLCHFLSLIYWIIPTISIFGGLPLFLALPILLLLAAYLALYPAMFAWGLTWLGSIGYFHTAFMPLTAAALWVSLEYLRSILFTGFPWGLVGYSQYMNLNLIQIADITSVYGLSFMVVLANAVVAKMVASVIFKKRLQADMVIWLLSLLVMFGVVIGYGKVRISDIEKESAQAESVKVSVIQGNIEQVFKWDEAYQESTVTKYCNLSIQAAQLFKQQPDQKIVRQDRKREREDTEQLKPDLIIWPETALPFYYSWNKKLSNRVDNCIKDAGTTFLIGSPAFKTVDKSSKTYEFYNRAYMVNQNGAITGTYDKVHLVPFGEYVPFGKYLSFLGKIIAQAGDFSSGKRDTSPLIFSVAAGDSSAGVLICFESIFPYLSRTAVKNGAQILVTMTNDAWFGYTSAPEQHFTMALFRAIENRRSVARAANTGISGFIDPTGKILQVSNLFEDIALTQTIPSMRIQTLYSKFGDIFAFVCLFAIGAAFVLNIAKTGDRAKK